MIESHFVRHLKHYPFRYLPGPGRVPSLETLLELRPTRFALGLSERVRWEKLAKASSAPVSGAFYLGRVTEVVQDEVIATVWERPNGREATTTLSVEKHFGGHPPLPGSLLRIWTWIELPGGGEERRMHTIDVEAPKLSDSQRRELSDLLEELKKDVAGPRKHDA